MSTLSDYGVTHDEPIYMEAAWNIKKWLSLEPRKIFTPTEIDRYWKTDPVRNIHPSGLKWLYLAAQKTIFWEKDPYRQNRVLNVLLFSISLLVFLMWWDDGGALYRGAVFIVLLLTIPRFFAHIHFAATDIPMISFMLLFIVFLDNTLFKRSFWLTGGILGAFASIKITSSLLAFSVLSVFILWYRHEWKKVLPRIALVCLIGLMVFYLLNPDWWFSPVSRCREFLTQSVTRSSWTPLNLYFGGQYYVYRGPFYYPFTVFSITTPLVHILLMLSGLAFFFIKSRLRNDFRMIILFVCLVFPFLILSLPISPTNDGVRYLLPAFPFAACFMTLGLAELWKFVRERDLTSPIRLASRWIIAGVALLLFSFDLNNPARNPPFELSYYNSLVGGLSGAHQRGYETTYWWETMNDDVIGLLNEACAGHSVFFPLPPTDLFFKHMLNDRKIKFLPVAGNPLNTDFMLIIGRPFVQYWESLTFPKYRREGKVPVPIWRISLDSVPLIQLYMIKKIKVKKRD